MFCFLLQAGVCIDCKQKNSPFKGSVTNDKKHDLQEMLCFDAALLLATLFLRFRDQIDNVYYATRRSEKSLLSPLDCGVFDMEEKGRMVCMDPRFCGIQIDRLILYRSRLSPG